MDQKQIEQFMGYIERHTSLSADDILKVVQSVDHADFSDETTVHGLVETLERLTHKELSPQKKQEVIRIITSNQQQSGLLSLLKFFH
ncbi:hypothetical protein HMI01_13020 [Halolactibacillus miurensis]|uniref:Stage VI sporulation protein F n=1 Tax=Halolactibacillus miurensis TaxID=306541 RepID=A0A1I6SWL6_9BACI|nr:MULTISPECIES: stage VI sporulation protein F [Halolactibacillus]GEM04314.1 hypothetical protein HMI01_13020 [Halolactibacillus miurensis]SFS81262.1 Stage VI sporulation protein F [Halolactibacillus miurensis]